MGILREFVEQERARNNALNGLGLDGLTPEQQLRRISSVALPLLRQVTHLQTFLYALTQSYGPGLDTKLVMECWLKHKWITTSPAGTEIKLTHRGEEQLAEWAEEDRLWQDGATPVEQPKRLKAGAPATNLQKIASIIGSDEVMAIHDPWFADSLAVRTLLKLRNYGTRFSRNLRILACNNGNRTTRQSALDWIADVNAEQGSNWKLLAYAAGDHGHRRFLLLKDGTLVTCGMSLNHTDKDETLDRLSPDTEEALHDVHFFNEKWQSARDLVSPV
jgi:hypothetical protein